MLLQGIKKECRNGLYLSPLVRMSHDRLGLLLLWLIVAVYSDSGEVYKDENNILVLDDSNFEEVLGLHPLLLVKFYAPWCGHCKKLAVEFNAAANLLNEGTQNPLLAKVDATVELKLSDRYGIEGYPRLKLFQYGRVSDYTGKRTSKEIATYMKDTKRKSSCRSLDYKKPIESLTSHINATGSDEDVNVFGFFDDPSCKSLECIAFQKVAPAHREIPCGIMQLAKDSIPSLRLSCAHLRVHG